MYETILVPTNDSEPAQVAERHAVEVAAKWNGTVHGLFVAEPEGTPLSQNFSPEEVEELFLDGTPHPAESLQERAAERGVGATAETRVGYIGEEILDYADELDADLIVMGTHGRDGIDRYLLGSTTERTLREGDRPVLCVQTPDEDRDDE